MELKSNRYMEINVLLGQPWMIGTSSSSRCTCCKWVHLQRSNGCNGSPARPIRNEEVQYIPVGSDVKKSSADREAAGGCGVSAMEAVMVTMCCSSSSFLLFGFMVHMYHLYYLYYIIKGRYWQIFTVDIGRKLKPPKLEAKICLSRGPLFTSFHRLVG